MALSKTIITRLKIMTKCYPILSARLTAISVGMLVATMSLHTGTAEAAPASSSIKDVKHFVVIYMENHSFDNRFGSWEGVNGRIGTYIKQVNQSGNDFKCLPQYSGYSDLFNVSQTCTDTVNGFTSGFQNAAFNLADYQKTDKCPDSPEFCYEEDKITHQFYQEQFQMNYGLMNRYVIANYTAGSVASYTETRTLPIYQYLHRQNSTVKYAIMDNFFHAAFGGSFLNHQWLVAARTPVWPNAVNDGSTKDLHSVVDINGMPSSKGSKNNGKYNPEYYESPSHDLPNVQDTNLTASCNPASNRGTTYPGTLCGDYVVNTSQPAQQPFKPGEEAYKQVPLQTHATIADRLSSKGVSWAWYGGGWSNANGEYRSPGWTNGKSSDRKCTDTHTDPKAVFPYCVNDDYSFHHNPLNFFKKFDRKTPSGMSNRKRHLRDEVEFRNLVTNSRNKCKLRAVSFVKPIWGNTSHSRGGNDLIGDQHLAELVEAVESSSCAANTMIIVTYDENGGEFDHVPPPGQNMPGVFDEWGPGTRVPSLVISPLLAFNAAVDSTQYDTTSILATLEERFGLAPLSSRDMAATSLSKTLDPKNTNLRPLPAP